MNRKLKKMLLCLLLILLMCALYELWLAPKLAILTGQPVREQAGQGAAVVQAMSQEEAQEEAAPARISVSKKEMGQDQNKITYFEIDVQLADATDLRTALAHDKYGRNVKDTLSDIAEEHGAAFAVNGDYYGYRSDGIVIRNGVLYRDNPSDRDCLVFYGDGTMEIVKEAETTGQELLDQGAWNVLSFGPALVKNGEPCQNLKDSYKVDDLNVSISGPEPRTAVGYLGPNHFLFLVVDGRQDGYSRGMDFEEMAKVFAEHGCENAYNLDGGGSVTLYMDGEIINNPCALWGKEREISDILYVAAR